MCLRCACVFLQNTARVSPKVFCGYKAMLSSCQCCPPSSLLILQYCETLPSATVPRFSSHSPYLARHSERPLEVSCSLRARQMPLILSRSVCVRAMSHQSPPSFFCYQNSRLSRVLAIYVSVLPIIRCCLENALVVLLQH